MKYFEHYLILLLVLMVSLSQTIHANEKIVISDPFAYKFVKGNIEKAAFDYALIARTGNAEMLEQMFTPQLAKAQKEMFGSVLHDETPILTADYAKFFQIVINPADKDLSHVVEIKHYLSEKWPEFGTLFRMGKINGVWKLI